MKAKLLHFASVATRGHYSNTILQKKKTQKKSDLKGSIHPTSKFILMLPT